jgi:hypothetical protein
MRALLLVSAFLALACSKDPSCDDLADKIMSYQVPEGMTRAPREQLVQNCKAEEATNLPLRRCVAASKSLGEAKGCEIKAALEMVDFDQKKGGK